MFRSGDVLVVSSPNLYKMQGVWNVGDVFVILDKLTHQTFKVLTPEGTLHYLEGSLRQTTTVLCRFKRPRKSSRFGPKQ